jgi:hypothetical protein
MTADELLACMEELILRLRQDCGLSVQEIEQLFEKGLVRHVLDATHGNVSKAALLFGKHRNGLARQMKKFGFDISQWDRKGSRGARVQDYYDSLLLTDQPERGLSQ